MYKMYKILVWLYNKSKADSNKLIFILSSEVLQVYKENSLRDFAIIDFFHSIFITIIIYFMNTKNI